MDFELNQRASIWAAVAVLVLIVGGYGIVNGLGYMKDQGTRVNNQKDLYQKKDQQLSQLKDFESKLNEAEEVIAKMNEALPVEKQKTSSMPILDRIASQAGVKLVDIDFTQSAEISDQSSLEGGMDRSSNNQPQLTSEELSVVLAGDFNKIKSFFQEIERSRRPFNPTTMELNKDGASINLTAYYLK